MPKQPMKLSVNEIKDALLNPELIKHLHGFNTSNQWGTIEGRQLLLDLYRLCERYEQLVEDSK